MKNQAKKTKIIESIKDIFEDSTIHAIPRVIKSRRKLMKIIWSFFFLLSAGYCSYLIFKAIDDYLDYDHVTNIDFYYEIPARFPSVQFCDLNQFATTEAKKFLNKYYTNLPTSLNSLFRTLILFDKLDSFNQTYINSLFYSLDDILIKCQFNMIECNSSDFIQVFDLVYGNCFIFNNNKFSNGTSRELLNISSNGYEYGLQLELYAASAFESKDLVKSNGYRVFVSNQSLNNYRNVEVFDISTGMNTNVNIDRNYFYKLEHPYNDCISNLDTIDSFDSDLFKLIIRSNYTYDQIDCFYVCFQKILIKSCNCSFKFLGPLSYNISCLEFDQIMCSLQAWEDFLDRNIFVKCSPECPAKCDSIKYSRTISMSDYPSRAYYDAFIKNNPVITSKFSNELNTYENVKSNVLALNVYYDSLLYTVTSQQEKTTPTDLVSNIGGLIGLFLGMSFLSLVEILECFFEIFYSLFIATQIN